MNELQVFLTTWRNLKSLPLSDRSHTKEMYNMIPFIESSQQTKLSDTLSGGKAIKKSKESITVNVRTEWEVRCYNWMAAGKVLFCNPVVVT